MKHVDNSEENMHVDIGAKRVNRRSELRKADVWSKGVVIVYLIKSRTDVS